MTAFAANPHEPVIVRSDDAEYLPEIGHRLLADASATSGALSAHRIQLAATPKAPSRTDTTAHPNCSSSSTGLSTCW